jgi:hypothetical protein
MSEINPSITFFIATIGKKTLTMVLRSLYGQFNHRVDKIEVFFDGPNFQEVGPEYFKSEQDLYGEDLRMTVLPQNLGCWGHSIRNTYQKTFSTDYIHHADDDDYYVEGALHSVREDLRNHFGKLILYQFRNSDGIRWKDRTIEHGNLGTPNGMIPNRPEIMGTWGEWAGGDAHFYATTADKIGHGNIVWMPTVIYAIRPHVYGLYK